MTHGNSDNGGQTFHYVSSVGNRQVKENPFKACMSCHILTWLIKSQKHSFNQRSDYVNCYLSKVIN